jgi:hypothetical protein
MAKEHDIVYPELAEMYRNLRATGAGDLIRLVLRQGVRLVVVSLALGIIAALALSRVLQDLAFDIGTVDPLTFVGMAALLRSRRRLLLAARAPRESGESGHGRMRTE